MTSWVMSIVGIICLGVMLDLIVPEGQTNKYIKGVFALLVIFVIISPLPQLIGQSVNFNLEGSAYTVDEGYLEKIEQMKIESKIETVERLLETNGLEATVTVNSACGSVSNISDISVVLSDDVIESADPNIYISSIKTLVTNLFEVDESAVTVVWGDYGN